MKGVRLATALAAAFSALLALPPAAAHAAGIADPGFSYVDVNNDGQYNPADGDIGPVDQYIWPDGQFDTGRSEGLYHAPPCPASLVVSHSMEPPFTVPVCLKAGVNLIVYGRIVTTGSIELDACRNVDLSLGVFSFGSKMSVQAGQDAILDAAQIAGDQATDSTLCVTACRDISARKLLAPGGVSPTPTGTNVADGAGLSFSSGRSTYVDGANIATDRSGATVRFDAVGPLELVDGTDIATLTMGDVSAQSRCDLVRLDNASVDGSSLTVCAYGSAGMASALFNTAGTTTIQAGGPVDATSLVSSASCFQVCSGGAVDLDSSNLFADPGGIQVQGRDDVMANDATWVAATEIDVTSTCGNILAQTADMETETLTGPIRFYAGGGLIVVTGSTFGGDVTFAPYGVTVIGPYVLL